MQSPKLRCWAASWFDVLTLILVGCLLSRLPVVYASNEAEEPRVHLRDVTHVVPLTDVNFEHETQAATGSTTGSWLVYFHNSNDQTPIWGEEPGPDVWAEHHVVVATVDIKTSTYTRERFGIKKLPAFIYIHQGKFYQHAKPNGGFTWSNLLRFVTTDHAEYEARPVPPSRTAWSSVVDLAHAAWTQGGVLFGGIGLVLGVLLSVAVVNLWLGVQNKGQQDAAKAKKS